MKRMEENIEVIENKITEKPTKPAWVKMKSSDVEDLIIELAKKGNSPAKIGLLLRDLYGVPKTKIFGVKIKKLLKKKGIEYEDEKKAIKKKILKLKTHLENNKHDHAANRALTKQLWVMHGIDKRSS